MKSLKFAVIQSGYCVFGVGTTEYEALIDACNWLGPDDSGNEYTPESLRSELAGRRGRVNGDLMLIDSENDEFDSYLENQGGFVRRGRGWYLQK